jgi:hypothetical protein
MVVGSSWPPPTDRFGHGARSALPRQPGPLPARLRLGYVRVRARWSVVTASTHHGPRSASRNHGHGCCIAMVLCWLLVGGSGITIVNRQQAKEGSEEFLDEPFWVAFGSCLVPEKFCKIF